MIGILTAQRGRMPEQPLTLLFGDPFRCEQALQAHHSRIIEKYPEAERHTLFGDKLDLSAFMVELQSAVVFAESRYFCRQPYHAFVAISPSACGAHLAVPTDGV